MGWTGFVKGAPQVYFTEDKYVNFTTEPYIWDVRMMGWMVSCFLVRPTSHRQIIIGSHWKLELYPPQLDGASSVCLGLFGQQCERLKLNQAEGKFINKHNCDVCVMVYESEIQIKNQIKEPKSGNFPSARSETRNIVRSPKSITDIPRGRRALPGYRFPFC